MRRPGRRVAPRPKLRSPSSSHAQRQNQSSSRATLAGLSAPLACARIMSGHAASEPTPKKMSNLPRRASGGAHEKVHGPAAHPAPAGAGLHLPMNPGERDELAAELGGQLLREMFLVEFHFLLVGGQAAFH